MRRRHPGPPSLLDALAERHIADAQARGDFDELPGSGAPLTLDDDALVPEELRAAYRLLKNAGCLPPELEANAEMRELERLLRNATTDDERRSLLARLNFLLSRRGSGARHLQIDDDYYVRVAERLNH